MNNKRLSNTVGPSAKLERKTNLIRFVALSSFVIITVVVLYTTISLSSEASPVQSIAPTSYAQMVTQNEGLKSSPWSFSSLTSTSEADDFRLSYSKLGVSSGSYQRILYDSETNTLRLNNISTTTINDNESARLSLSQQQSQSQSNKQISDSDRTNLQQMIKQNGFFQLNSMYALPNTTQSYDTVYILSLDMANKLHTVIWTDTSENIPGSLLSIVKAVEKISSAQQSKK